MSKVIVHRLFDPKALSVLDWQDVIENNSFALKLKLKMLTYLRWFCNDHTLSKGKLHLKKQLDGKYSLNQDFLCTLLWTFLI